MKTRVDATKDKIELLQEMQGMINTLKAFSARIDEKINKMIDTDLKSMAAEKDIIEEMSELIKLKDNDTKRGTTKRAK